MPAPFVSYLRVYEPLRAFEGPSGALVRAGLERGPVPVEQAGDRDRLRCLRAQLAGEPLPAATGDVLVVQGSAGPLVCPLDVRPRAAVGLLAFLGEATEQAPALRAAASVVPEARARLLAQDAVAELGEATAHVVAASWTVPLPWFALVDADKRQFRPGPPRRVWWQVPIGRAIVAAAHAEIITRDALGEGGPAEVLAETRKWLQRFDKESVLELDYGGLVQLMDDATLRADTSAADVKAGLTAMRTGDGEHAEECYARLREFWGALAERERDC